MKPHSDEPRRGSHRVSRFFIRPTWWMAILAVLLISACFRPAATTNPMVTPGPSATGTQAPVGVRPGTTAPEFSLHTHVGEDLQLANLRGRAVILYFWNTSCNPCNAEMTALQELYALQEPNGLTIVGVNNREQSLDVGAYGKNLGITYPLVLDREGSVAELYKVRNFPAAFFIDRNGVITDVQNQVMKAEDLEQMAQKILATVSIQPTVTATTPPAAVTSLEGCVTADALNVRDAPNTEGTAVRLLTNAECTQFDARNADSTWLRLAEPQENPRQWVSAQYVEIKGQITDLPVGE